MSTPISSHLPRPSSTSASIINLESHCLRMIRPLSRKLVVVGDGGCGKSSLLTVFTQGSFPTSYEPTVFENYVEIVDIDGQQVELSLWDTAGQEDFDRLRALSYADTHVVMICFSVDDPVSLENIETKWAPEVNKHCPGVKTIMTALKCDLRQDPIILEKLEKRGGQPVSYEDGLALARKLKATRYLECSAKLNRGVQEAIMEATQVSMTSRPKGGGSSGLPGCCIIL